jgi:AAA family ATP:ADP antiporter
MWAGLRLAAKSSYLLGICAYLLLLTMSATVLYLEQMAVISREITAPESRTRLFAGIDLTVNLLTFLTQALVTNRLVLRFGLGAALMFLPAVSALGFLALAVSPLLPVFLLFTVVRRVGEYAISKPAREVLFTVVSREEKYKAKNFIDTTVSRGGDASTGWVVSGIKALGASATHLAWLLIPLMIVWGWIARFLARREASLQQENKYRS